MPTRSFEEIFERHRGPYTLCAGGFKNAKGDYCSRWLKRKGGKLAWADPGDDNGALEKIDSEDVVGECLGYLGDPQEPIGCITVYSVPEQSFVTTFRREDVSYDQAAARAAFEAKQMQTRETQDVVPVVPRKQRLEVQVAAPPSRQVLEPGEQSDAGPASAGAEGVAGGVLPRDGSRPAPLARRARPDAGQVSARGSAYVVVEGAEPAKKLAANAGRIWEAFKARGKATVAEVASDCADINVGDVKALVASYATRFKADGLLTKEEK